MKDVDVGAIAACFDRDFQPEKITAYKVFNSVEDEKISEEVIARGGAAVIGIRRHVKSDLFNELEEHVKAAYTKEAEEITADNLKYAQEAAPANVIHQ